MKKIKNPKTTVEYLNNIMIDRYLEEAVVKSARKDLRKKMNKWDTT